RGCRSPCSRRRSTWCRARASPTPRPRTNRTWCWPSRERTRLPPADVIGLGRWRAAGFVAPALLLVGVFLVFPALWTLYIGATDFRLTGATAQTPDMVGLANYGRALGDATFYRSLWLTLVYVLGSAVVGQNIFGFALAYSLRTTGKALRRVIEALALLAWILPGS